MFANDYPEFQDGDSRVFDQGHCETGRFDGTGPMCGPCASPVGRKWQPAPASLPGESHGPGILVGYSPWFAKSLSDSHFHFPQGPPQHPGRVVQICCSQSSQQGWG